MASDIHKVFLKARDLKEVRSIPHLHEILVLTYILNTMRSSQRLVMSISGRPESPTTSRDNLFGLLVNISFTYEAMKRASGILSKLVISLPKELHNDIAWVISEVHIQKDSFFNTILERLRNGIAFHFNLAISEDHVAEAIKAFPVLFGEGLSRKIVDWSYVLVDDIVTKYFARYDQSTVEPSDKAINLLGRLSEYNHKFCNTLEQVVAELMVNYTEENPMVTIDLNRFPFATVQDGSVFCIPAASLAIFRYHKPQFGLSQFDLMKWMIEGPPDHLPSFGAMVMHVGPKVKSEFNLVQLNPSTFTEWLDNIRNDLARQYPIAIATRFADGPHIRVVVQLDEQAGHMGLFNPGIGATNLLIPSPKGVVGGWLVLQSGIEIYTLKQSEDDWNGAQRCGDQLRVEPI
jgi:hypothetical protein